MHLVMLTSVEDRLNLYVIVDSLQLIIVLDLLIDSKSQGNDFIQIGFVSWAIEFTIIYFKHVNYHLVD
jgi:hypothetical protein